MGRRVALDRGDDDFSRALLGLILRCGDALVDHLGAFVLQLVRQIPEELLLGLVQRELGGLQQFVALLAQEFVDFDGLLLRLGPLLAKPRFGDLDVLLLGSEHVELALEYVLPLVDPLFSVPKLISHLGRLTIEFFLSCEKRSLGLDLCRPSGFLGLLLCVGDDSVRVPPGFGPISLRNKPSVPICGGGADHGGHQHQQHHRAGRDLCQNQRSHGCMPFLIDSRSIGAFAFSSQ